MDMKEVNEMLKDQRECYVQLLQDKDQELQNLQELFNQQIAGYEAQQTCMGQ